MYSIHSPRYSILVGQSDPLRRCILKRVAPSTVDTKRPPPSARPRSPGMALRATRPSRPPSGEWRSGCNYQRARWCANRKSASASNPPGTPSPVRARVGCGPPPTPPRNLASAAASGVFSRRAVSQTPRTRAGSSAPERPGDPPAREHEDRDSILKRRAPRRGYALAVRHRVRVGNGVHILQWALRVMIPTRRRSAGWPRADDEGAMRIATTWSSCSRWCG